MSGWDNECKESNTARLKLAGMKGHGSAVDVSHINEVLSANKGHLVT